MYLFTAPLKSPSSSYDKYDTLIFINKWVAKSFASSSRAAYMKFTSSIYISDCKLNLMDQHMMTSCPIE